MDGLLWPSVCLLYLANTFFFFLKKTDESSGSVKDPFFLLLLSNLANNPWVQTDH